MRASVGNKDVSIISGEMLTVSSSWVRLEPGALDLTPSNCWVFSGRSLAAGVLVLTLSNCCLLHLPLFTTHMSEAGMPGMDVYIHSAFFGKTISIK